MSVPAYESYKDSGVEWLGDVPSHWELLPLKRLLEIQNGRDHKEVQAEEGYPVIGSGGVFAYSSEKMFDGESVLLGRKGTVDKPLYINGPFWTVDTMYWTKIRTGINGRYAYYACLIIPFSYYSTNTALPSMTSGQLNRHLTTLPPLPEQTVIATFLDRETAKIDALIAEQQRLIELLKQKRQAVISHAVTKGLNPDAPMKDSGVEWLGMVPTHWEIKRIGSLFNEAIEIGVQELPILSVSIHTGVSDKELAEDELDRKVTRSEDRLKYKRVRPRDLVYNMMRAWQGGFGSVSVDGMVSPAYVVARPSTKLKTELVEAILRTPNAVEEMRRHSKGVTDFRLRLYWDSFKDICIAVPSSVEQKAIADHIQRSSSEFDALVSQCAGCIELLQERRSAIISEAVTGKIDVRGLVKHEQSAEVVAA
jgi:type I restriction enzyme S subunit